jgi:hypothetical protein
MLKLPKPERIPGVGRPRDRRGVDFILAPRAEGEFHTTAIVGQIGSIAKATVSVPHFAIASQLTAELLLVLL